MFVGTHTPRLDDKGRLSFPAKYREQLKGGVVVTKGQERCLTVYPTDEFNRVRQEVAQAPQSSKQARDFRRIFLAAASDDLPDKQGRITIPPKLREYAGLDREVAVLGQGEFIEIWDLTAWEAYEAAEDAAYSGTDDGVVLGN